jgi:hypothetical protein
MKNRWLVAAAVVLPLFVLSRLLFHYVPGSEEIADVLVDGLFYLPFILLGPVLVIFLPRYRRSARHGQEGLRLMSQGHIAAALEQFEAARPLARVKVVPTYHIGISRLQLWQLEAAERELSSLTDRDDLTPVFRSQLFSALALVAALDGRLWQAVQRLDEVKTLGGGPFVAAVLASAVIACRREAWAEAKQHLERPECDKLDGPLRGLREALRALCLERLTGERHSVDAVTVFGEASPKSLQAAWPELAAFLLREPSQPGAS